MSTIEFYSILGQLSSWVVAVIIGAALVRFLGERWLENKFSKNLEAYKAQILHKFDLLLTRKVKWHETEHEVLSLSWIKLMDVYNALKRSTGMLRQMPNLDKMNESKLKRFAEKNNFSDDETEYLLSEENKTSAYSRILDFRCLKKAHDLFNEFRIYFENNKVFLRPNIKEKFSIVEDYIWSAWVDTKMGLDDQKISWNISARKKVKDEIEPVIKEIEELLQKELFPEESKKSN